MNSHVSITGFEIRPFVESDEEAVVELWHECGLIVPWNDARMDIARKLKCGRDLFLVADSDQQIVGTVMAGYEGHRGWINYLAVAPEVRRCGLGRRLMAEAEVRLRKLGCPKISLMVRKSNQTVVDFYERLGFQLDDVVSLGKRLVVDSPTVLPNYWNCF